MARFIPTASSPRIQLVELCSARLSTLPRVATQIYVFFSPATAELRILARHRVLRRRNLRLVGERFRERMGLLRRRRGGKRTALSIYRSANDFITNPVVLLASGFITSIRVAAGQSSF